LEEGQADKAGKLAYQAMLRAARGLVKLENANISQDADQVVGEFRIRFYDTQKFFDPFAGGKFAHYLFAAQQKSNQPHTADSARYLIDEAHLFVEAAHSCYQRMGKPVSV
jgi:sulfite reductase (ferredoxin)